jgi:soluble lytic murein transglycosylase
LLGALALLLALGAPAATAGPPAWRFAAEPADGLELALREAASRDGAAGIDALRALAGQHPGTEVAGLARLGAGLRLLDGARPADAIAQLSHPDVARTRLRDRALLALGHAYESLTRLDEAASASLAAAAEPEGTVACEALSRAGELLSRARRPDDAVSAIERAIGACPSGRAALLLSLGEAQLARGDRPAAAAAFDRLDREHVASAAAADARRHLKALADVLPPVDAGERARRGLERGSALLAAGRSAEAVEALRAVPLASLEPAEADLARVRLGRALLARGRAREGLALLRQVRPESAHAAEAAYHLARSRARATGSPEAYEPVADRFRDTEWAEEALYALATHYQKDALDAAALPWWRRLVAEHPQGRYVERAAWRAAWADYLARRYEPAASTLEAVARSRPPSSATPGFLYWAGRARQAQGDAQGARRLLEETVRRYKHAYHGLRARDALARMGAPAPAPRPALLADAAADTLPEPHATRLRQLLLLERLDGAAEELRRVPETPRALATLAWIDWRRGRLRPAIVTMKRAYPEWVGEAGDRLPADVWQILYPLRYEGPLGQAAAKESLDPALVAALILQESTFDPQALSRAGARGLMQVMPATGRSIARAKGQRFRRAALNDPRTSLDFGTHYLRQMSDRFDGAVEKVLAAYNAGPHRVDKWTAARGERSAEEFIEGIPFTETRGYVMIVLANREQYRRIYGLGRTPPGPVSEGARP